MALCNAEPLNGRWKFKAPLMLIHSQGEATKISGTTAAKMVEIMYHYLQSKHHFMVKTKERKVADFTHYVRGV